jgi:hypothetical protein
LALASRKENRKQAVTTRTIAETGVAASGVLGLGFNAVARGRGWTATYRPVMRTRSSGKFSHPRRRFGGVVLANLVLALVP